jgi:mRNA interferase MazF
MVRGEIWWAALPDSTGSAPGYRRPVVILQANSFNRSRIKTLIIAAITSNLALADAPGNVLLPANVSGLPKDSVINVSQLLTVEKAALTEKVGDLPSTLLARLEKGLRLVLAL